jgi:hypothetical protein
MCACDATPRIETRRLTLRAPRMDDARDPGAAVQRL